MAIFDLARMTVASSGTGTITLSAAVTGFNTFDLAGCSTASTGQNITYAINDTTASEIGNGTYFSTSLTVTRGSSTNSLKSTNSNSPINMSRSAQVAITPAANDMPLLDSLAYNGMQVNGNTDVSQEYGTTLTTIAANAYPMDGWQVSFVGTMVIQSQQVSDAPAGYSNSLKFTVTTAQASLGGTDFCAIRQNLEGYRVARLQFGTANAQAVSIAVWIKANRTGAYSGSLFNSSDNRFYPFTITVSSSNTWEYKTFTIYGDTSGTWLLTNGIGLKVNFNLACGATYQGTAGAWTSSVNLGVTSNVNGVAATSDTFQLAGLIVLPGVELPSSTRASFIMRSFDQELLLCQRYYRKSFPYGTAVAQNAGTGGAVSVKNPIALGDPAVFLQFAPTMRAAPTIVTYNPSAANANWRNLTAAADATVSVDPSGTVNDSGVIIATSGTVTTLGDILAIHYTANARL